MGKATGEPRRRVAAREIRSAAVGMGVGPARGARRAMSANGTARRLAWRELADANAVGPGARPPVALPLRRGRRARDRHPLLLVGVLLLTTAPLVRGFAGDVPIYLVDLVLLALAAAFFRPHQLPPDLRAVLATGAVFAASTVPSALISLAVYDHPSFTLYYYARRLIAYASFGTFLILLATEPARRRLLVHALLGGLVLSSLWCIAQALTRSSGLVGAIDHAYYDVLVQPVLEPSINRWAASWKTARAVGGWWNANTAGAALALLLPVVAAARADASTAVAAGVAWVALCTTGSRQALAGATLFLATVAFWGERRVGRSRRGLAAGVALGVAAAFLLAGDQLARVVGHAEGGLDEGIISRWDNYPAFFAAISASGPLTLLFGRGAESWAVVGRTSAAFDSSAFVSNSLLLTLAESGIVSLIALTGFLACVLLAARTAWQRGVVLIVVWLLNCDNHLYLSPALATLATAALALAAAPLEPVAVRRRAPVATVAASGGAR
jgi:hypothetical protein